MWQRWQPSAAIDNDDALRQHHHDAIEHTAAFADGEKHQPHRRQPIHASGPSACGANGSAGPTSWHQWHPLNIGFRHFCLSCWPYRRLGGSNARADGNGIGGALAAEEHP
jgi:hypothetical protein